MDFNSFLTPLRKLFVIFVVLMCLFTWLSRRPGNNFVYYPNRILKGMDPWESGSQLTRNPLAWTREALSSSEKVVVAMSGVDSAAYFVFLSTVFGIFIISAVVLLLILLLVAATEKHLKQ